MKPKLLFFCILLIFTGLLPMSAFAQQNQIPIFVVATFDYPGAGNSTTPLDINERGEIVGYYVDANNVRRGFLRRLNGNFTAIVAPNDTGNYTTAFSINNNQTITGDYFNNADAVYHGFLRRNGVYTQYDGGGAWNGTGILGINDNEDFVGGITDPVAPQRSFVNIGGTQTFINIPGAFESVAYGINNANRAVGFYRDAGLVYHGFIRSANGALTNPVDFPGSSSTNLQGINNRGWIVGRYTDAQGREHGLFRKNASTYVSFDYPNATATSINGINDYGFIVGRYTDAAGRRHGFAAFALAF
ncbi:MAG: DUF3466 family protein [Pyrinomonadaceae bacterium]|nr:DUF3466 family protein [Pyrinomonadaceae bacterium]